MKKIILMLEYGTKPIWVKEERDEFPFPDMPEEGHATEEFVRLSEDIQDRYDSLFIDNEHEFSYVGFQNAEESDSFIEDLRRLASLTKELFGGIYEIEDKFNYDHYRVND